MTITTADEDLTKLEERAAEHMAEGVPAESADKAPAEADEPSVPAGRMALAVGCTTLATAVMVGGVFTGVAPRIYATLAGALGILLAAHAGKLRRALVANAVVALGLFAIGLLMIVFTGPDNLFSTGALVQRAARAGDVLRPPVPWEAGWAAIVGWLMATVGFVAAWTGLVLRRTALAIMVPLPVLGIGAISVPESAQLASGLICLVLFAVALGVLSSAQLVGEDDQKVPIGYELRRAARSLPLVAFITVALYFLAQTNFLFPEPLIDPTEEPQRPKTVPLSEVEDRVLFEVGDTGVSGPWRIGSLDVYDGKDWRLPPFSENRLDAVPRSGIVDPDLDAGVRATFTVAGLGGSVLPGLPNTVGIRATGPRLAYDDRNGNIRVDQGQIEAGLAYTVTAAALPSVDDLKTVGGSVPNDVARFLEIPEPPPAVQDLLNAAPTSSLWDKLDYVRTFVLENVVATGEGSPVSVTPERVQDMLAGSKEGSPYEIVAAQAMLARWAGVPSRIGYGFDGGDEVDGKIQVRPKHGATFLEVYFSGFKWLPVIGTPLKAKPTVGNKAQQQTSPDILPSEDVSVQLYLPVVLPLAGVLGEQIRNAIVVVGAVLLVLFLLYLTWPAVRKAMARARRRTQAAERGLDARIANAYAEWRDFATDYGYRHDSDTPLMFLQRFARDDEHTELAWLVTRALFGDLRDQLSFEHALAAEELSRTLRRRLAQAHPATMRVVASVSRTSLRHPYAPGLRAVSRRERRRAVALAPA